MHCLLAIFQLVLTGPANAVDGDTIVIEGVDERVRLFGIQAPELGRHGTRSQPGSRVAQRALSRILSEGEVSCVHVDRDRYGRHVAICSIDGEDIAPRLMGAAKWVREWCKYSGGYYGKC